MPTQATLQDVMHQYTEQLPLKEKIWSALGDELQARLVSSVVASLKFNNLPVPRDQLIIPVATVPAPLPLPETSSSLSSVELDEVHELERERTVYQKKRLMSIEKARAYHGVGETSHDIADHSPEHSSSNSDAD
ncbi:hypothetical protein EMCRGX_G028964 [Ephydatia muelleri]